MAGAGRDTGRAGHGRGHGAGDPRVGHGHRTGGGSCRRRGGKCRSARWCWGRTARCWRAPATRWRRRPTPRRMPNCWRCGRRPRVRGEPRLPDCDLVVTLEPCPMCAQAISLFRIRRLVFGAYDPEGRRGGAWRAGVRRAVLPPSAGGGRRCAGERGGCTAAGVLSGAPLSNITATGVRPQVIAAQAGTHDLGSSLSPG